MLYENVCVAGGGVLGSQIAFQSAYRGHKVVVWLRSEASIGRAKPKFEKLRETYLATLEAMKTNPAAYAYGLIAKDEITPEKLDELKEQVERAAASIVLTTSAEEAFSGADLIIEAVAEVPEQKHEFYHMISPFLKDDAVVLTNSSTLLPSQFAEDLPHPERYLALHFANEIWAHPTAEVMGHAGTDHEIFESVVAFANDIRMIPLRVLKEQPGYLLNSLLVPFLNAAQLLWAGGVGTPEDIDRAWTLGTGAPAGPFRILDIVGLETAYNIGRMHPAAADPTSPQAKVVAMLKEKIDAGETGITAGKGFYNYK